MNIARSLSIVAPLLLSLSLAACATPQEKAVDASNARHDANVEKAVISQETQQQEAEIQRKAADESDRNAREAAQKMNAADSVANKKGMEAVDALLKARADLRDSSSKRRDSLDKDVIDLRTKIGAMLSPAEADSAQQMLRAKSIAVRDSIVEINTATVETLGAVKKTIDMRLADFETAIGATRKRVE
ncbi:MAG: hypothetical protein ABI193_09360 [Minicystis sp.]